MKRIPFIFALAAALALAAAAEAQPRYDSGSDNSLRFRLGIFTPDGDSEYWDDNFDVFTGEAEDLQNFSLGVDFLYGLGPGGILLSGDFYEGEEDLAYLDFVDAQGFDIVHANRLSINSLTAGYMLQFAPGARVSPYIGAGGGVYFWEIEEEGDFIDFFVAPPELFNASFSDDGEAFGWYWLAGVELDIGPQWGAFVEARGHNVDDELGGDDFEEFGEIDLSGLNVSGGVSFSF